uniref:Uncharacterized protein n=1 Tax=Kalanchoe fedtschenkoi TaxID=63787 RepID=A0A7N0T3R6_KALFE
MENVLCAKMQPSVRKVKKKQGKDELDRIKQAEKKKRRLEKALATSAAIRLELEKKKQKKREEQQRLDEEGAAIAEAVALNVLLGEDTDDSCKLMLKKKHGYDHWDCPNNNVGIFAGGRMFNFPHQNVCKCSFGGVGWVSSNGQLDAGANKFWPVSSGSCARSIYAPCIDDDGRWRTEDATAAAGRLAAQALSTLQIAEESNLETAIFNGMFERFSTSQGS